MYVSRKYIVFKGFGIMHTFNHPLEVLEHNPTKRLGVSKMVHQVNAFATKPDDLISIPGIHMVGEN